MAQPWIRRPRRVQLCGISMQILPEVENSRGPTTSYHRVGKSWLMGSNLAQVGSSCSSCPPCSSILSNLAPTWLQLGPSLLQLGPTYRQLGPTWSHLGSTWLQLGPILVPTWSNMVPKSDQDELQEVFSSLSKRSSVFY